MSAWLTGDVVEHLRWGRGRVEKVLHQGMEYMVRFDFGALFRLDRRGLTLVSRCGVAKDAAARPGEPAAARAPMPVEKPAGAATREVHEKPSGCARPVGVRGVFAGTGELPVAPEIGAAVDVVRARSVLEAFRLGIVPRHAVGGWTFGREQEIERIRYWLKDFSQGALLLEGEYGSGKTHLLEYIAHHAAELQYAVSVVRLDPNQGTVSFPWRLYREVLRELSVPTPTGLEDIRSALLKSAGRVRDLPWLMDHAILGGFFHALEGNRLHETDWAAFMGEEVQAPHFSFHYDYTTVGNVVCNILGCIAEVMVRCLDLNGLIVLIDEAEMAQTYLYRLHWERGLNLLRGLTLSANDDPVIMEEEVVKKDGAYTGTRSGLVYSGHFHDMRYLNRVPSFLKVAAAITPGGFSRQFLSWKEGLPVLSLDRIPAKSMEKLVRRIRVEYSALFGSDVTAEEERASVAHLREVGASSSTRSLIKGVLELLDFRRFHPEAPIDRLLGARWP